ncbi:YjfB family protein [Lentibacillus sediminis]|uniref:YjfB family protein n=1 Tax=Lentibacillus sediminis TaxID=1940529 RepID=UPI000C1C4F32|nr:YjfB family protein [Lentibacillus sediminis]
MDIAMMSTAMSQFQVQQQVQLSVMNKVMDQSQENSDGLQKLLKSADISAMQQSVEPNLGASVDVKV